MDEDKNITQENIEGIEQELSFHPGEVSPRSIVDQM